MAPRSDPLHIDMTDGYLAPENPGKRQRKPRKDINGDVINPPKAPNQHQPPPIAGQKRAREPTPDDIPVKRAKNTAKAPVNSPRTVNIAAGFLLDIPSSAPPAPTKPPIRYAPESYVRPIQDLEGSATPPASPTNHPYAIEDAEAYLESRGKDPAVAPPTAAYLSEVVGPRKELKEGHKCLFTVDPVSAKVKAEAPWRPLITAGIPMEEFTPEDLVKYVEAKRKRASAVARKRKMIIVFTDRAAIRRTSTPTNPLSISESPIISKPSSSTTGKTSQKIGRSSRSHPNIQ